jgi:cell shape-determining protein MreC
MNSELISMKQRSLDIINSVELHQGIISGCDEILQTLNPEIAEKQKQEQENKQLREEINSLKEMFQEFLKQMK